MFYVLNRLVILVTIFACLLGMNTHAFAENICECPSPPGGAIRCEDHQVGFCNLDNGKIDGACMTPPENQSSGKKLDAWVLSVLLQKTVTPEMIQKNKKFQEILYNRALINPRTGQKTKFSLPR